jgi:hypothetical protein
MTGHEIGLLKEYMQDLIEQARQESRVFGNAGYREEAYSPDQALMDLLAILDDRIESEGVQVGLSEGFPHRMWEICRKAERHVRDTAWLSANLDSQDQNKTQVRTISYRALLEFIEKEA